jgi:hypothetical protein
MLLAVASLLVVIIALLAIPLTLAFQASWQQSFQSEIKLIWLFGIVQVRLPSSQEKTSSHKKPRHNKKRKHKKQTQGKNGFLATIRQQAIRRQIIKFIHTLWHAVKKRGLMLHLRIGLDDPADTGQLWAIIGPIAGALANSKEIDIHIEPEFSDPIFELESRGTVRLIPLQIIYLTIALLLIPLLWQRLKKTGKPKNLPLASPFP